MPWRECSVMDERMRFVARRLAGEPMAELCREFGISRKTGYKIVDRYQECGIHGLTDRSRRPFRLRRRNNHLDRQDVREELIELSMSFTEPQLPKAPRACRA